MLDEKTNNKRESTIMKNLTTLEITSFALACVALVCTDRAAGQTSLPINAAALTGNAGVTFVFAPTTNPNIFTITADGAVSLSLAGNWSEHAQLQVQFPTSPGQPIALSGTATLTTSDGANTLTFSVTGTASPDPANPAFFNNTYQVTFTGGTGAFASASGSGSINETVKFTSPLTGTGTWKIKGYVLTPPAGS